MTLCLCLIAAGGALCSPLSGDDEFSARSGAESEWRPVTGIIPDGEPSDAMVPTTGDSRLHKSVRVPQWMPIPNRTTPRLPSESAQASELVPEQTAVAPTADPPLQTAPESLQTAPESNTVFGDSSTVASPAEQTTSHSAAEDAEGETPLLFADEDEGQGSSEEPDGAAPDVPAGRSVGWFQEMREATSTVYLSALTGLEDWTKRFEVGARLLAGNSDQQSFNMAGRLENNFSERHFAELDAGGDYARNRGDKSSNRWFANGTYDVSRDGDWILFATSRNEFDEFRNLNWRGTLSGGVGYRFFNEKNKRLIARIGPAVTHEFYYNPTVHRTTPDIFAELELLWPLHDRSDFESKLTIRPSLDDISIFRLNSQSGLLFRIDDGDRWKLKLGFWVDYQARPAVGSLRADYTSSISLIYVRK